MKSRSPSFPALARGGGWAEGLPELLALVAEPDPVPVLSDSAAPFAVCFSA